MASPPKVPAKDKDNASTPSKINIGSSADSSTTTQTATQQSSSQNNSTTTNPVSAEPSGMSTSINVPTATRPPKLRNLQQKSAAAEKYLKKLLDSLNKGPRSDDKNMDGKA